MTKHKTSRKKSTHSEVERVLAAALEQTRDGKGNERHGFGKDFMDQPMMLHLKLHGAGFGTGQAGKKATEALSLPKQAALDELLGAIVYLAGTYLHIENESE